MIGQVESYSDAKRYGFIRGDDGRKYYVSRGNIDKNRVPSGVLHPGNTVEFNTGEGNKAFNVKYL